LTIPALSPTAFVQRFLHSLDPNGKLEDSNIAEFDGGALVSTM